MAISVTCPKCEKTGRVPDHVTGSVKCPQCGERFPVSAPQPTVVAPSSTQEVKPCRFCGEEILAVAVKCKHCGEFLSERSVPKSGWNGIAACLSFFWAGLGQIYKGTFALGIAWSLLITVFYGLGIGGLVYQNPAGLILIILGAVFHCLCVRDAGLNRDKPSRFPLSALRVTLLLVVVYAIGSYVTSLSNS